MPVKTIIQLRRDTAANWTSTNPVLAAGEQGFETDTKKIKVGDGTTAWASLAYSGATVATLGDVTVTSAADGDLLKYDSATSKWKNVTQSTITAGSATTATTATKATGIAGGTAGKVPYQTAADTTAFTAVGTSGDFLTSGGTGSPTWTSPSALPTKSQVSGTVTTGYYNVPPGSNNGNAQGTGGNTIVTFTPYLAKWNMTMTSLSVNVTTSSSGNTQRLGLYSAGTNGLPDSRLNDFGTVSLTSTGFKTITGLSVSLTAGTTYWFATSGSSAGAGANFTGIGTGSTDFPLIDTFAIPQTLSSGTSNVKPGVTAATTSGALPSSAGTITAASWVPVLWIGV